MVMEQQNSQDWQQQLLAMGYERIDVSRAYEAGVTGVAHAVDWLLANPSQPDHHQQDTSQQWPLISDTVQIEDQSSSDPNTYQKRQQEDVRETGRSIDNLALARPTTATPPVAAEGLRNKQEDELQRVMEMSRKEYDETQIETAMRKSKEDTAARQSADQDPELFRAIAESLNDNPDLLKDQNASWHSQPFANPMERLRQSTAHPVGLRNIGNTCYLNSLLQVYYYLPDFRRVIMSFRAPDYQRDGVVDHTNETDIPPRDEVKDLVEGPHEAPMSAPSTGDVAREGGASDNSDNRITKLAEDAVQRNAVEFVVELQRLFSTMALGNQNCADPTAVTRAMRDDHGKPISIGAQRDASEFNQVFLDTVEKGLSASSSNLITEYCDQEKTSGSENEANEAIQPISATENIVKNMFTMKFRQEIWRCSEDPIRNVTATKKPITTNWETTSIIVDATTRHERNLHGGLEDFVLTQIKYLDWSRDSEEKSDSLVTSSEDQTTNNFPAEGVSDKTPYAALKTVWFTRLPPVVVIYLQRGSYNRETLRAEKVHDRYDFPTRLAFDRYLEVNREAAEAARREIHKIRNERNYLLNLLDQYKRFPVEDVSASHPFKLQHDNWKLSQDKLEPEREDFFDAGARIQKRLREAMQPDSAFHAVSSLTRERIESSLDTIEKILDHDRKRCNELEARLLSIKSESDVYRGLDKVMYNLHAVLVHDGAPESGHYWAFIDNSTCENEGETWIKLSDSNVTLVSEKEMLSWSLGGNGKASAYCLMYTISNNTHEHKSIAEESMILLPRERLDEVAEASAAFGKEIEAVSKSS